MKICFFGRHCREQQLNLTAGDRFALIALPASHPDQAAPPALPDNFGAGERRSGLRGAEVVNVAVENAWATFVGILALRSDPRGEFDQGAKHAAMEGG